MHLILNEVIDHVFYHLICVKVIYNTELQWLARLSHSGFDLFWLIPSCLIRQIQFEFAIGLCGLIQHMWPILCICFRVYVCLSVYHTVFIFIICGLVHIVCMHLFMSLSAHCVCNTYAKFDYCLLLYIESSHSTVSLSIVYLHRDLISHQCLTDQWLTF